MPLYIDNGEAPVNSITTGEHLVINHSGIPGVGDLSVAAHATTDHTGITGVEANRIVQQIRSIKNVFQGGIGVIPFDNTIPQNTEGAEVLTAVITPTSLSNTLLIEFSGFLAHGVGAVAISALFRDTIGSAIAVTGMSSQAGVSQLVLRHFLTVPSLSSQTYKIRVGTSSGTAELNSVGGGVQAFGGVASTILTVTEIAP